jgi:uncharacterized damage-inducible protein DinB
VTHVEIAALLDELFGRIAEHVHGAVDGLGADELAAAPAPGANPIGWLVWHLTRVQDHHIAELLGERQVWMTEPWPPRFGLTADPDNTGYGHRAADVAAVQADGADALTGYYDAVAARTSAFLATLSAADLDRVVDERWDPPVTLGVRLVSVADDDIQHGGQAAYARGLRVGR